MSEYISTSTEEAEASSPWPDSKDVSAAELQHPLDGKVAEMIPLMVTASLLGVTILIIILGIVLRHRHRKSAENETAGPSIVVYPSYQGMGPQFLTKEIRFSLPSLREASSMSDLLPGESEQDSDVDTDSLVPVSGAHSQRSNSFSSYGLGMIDPALYRIPADLEEELQFPDGHLGRVWFSVKYEAATEKLLVTLVKARNLPSRTVGTVNSCDPYIRVHLIPNERRSLQSRHKKRTCNPYFDETFVLQVPQKDVMDQVLKLTVIDTGRAKKKAVIGHVNLPLNDINITEQRTYKMDLEKEVQEKVSDLGELLISLMYNENLRRLSVAVIEAKRLKFKEEGKKDSYVRVTLNQQYRTVKVKKTSPVKDAETPHYSECFNFRMSSATIDVTSVGFHVMQSVSGYGRDKLIGKCVLGSYMFARGKALSHWNTAFANPMEQIQHWHALSE